MTNEVEKVPQLRFPNFDGEWEEKQLGDVTKTNQGLQIAISDRKTKYEKGLYFYITNEFLRPNSQTKYYIENPPESVVAEKSDILMTRTGNTGKVITNVEGAFHNNFFKIKYNKSIIDRLFLFELLKSPKINNKFLSLAGTSTIPDLNHSDFYSVYISFPTISEQQKISTFFSKLDRQIELEEEKLELLEQQKRGYMQKIFSQEVRFKDDNGNSYPEWEAAPLFDIFSATKGKSLSKDKISDDGKYECILYGEIYTAYAEKIESIVSRTNYYEGILSKKNDLIFPNSTTTNAWDLATFSSLQKNNVLIGGDISILRTKRSDISSLFYAYYLTNYLKLRKDIAKYAQGITIVHLSFNNFCKIKVQIPSLEEQNSITDFIDSLNQQQKLITNKIKLLKERKKGFLQKMFV